MQYATPELARMWMELRTDVHPDLVELLRALDRMGAENVLPEPVLTSLIRPPGAKFSWHELGCAADLRVHHYSDVQAILVMAWLGYRCQHPLWELLRHDVGQGDHIHVGRRDYSRRRTADVVTDAPPQGDGNG